MSTLGKRQGEDAQQRPNKRIRQRELKKVAHKISTQPPVPRPVTKSEDVKSNDKKIITLPSQIHVEKYLSSYAYEIQSLQNAIKSSSGGSSIRAWQMLPRHKRRRNASHNLLSLPRRLRSKGAAELRASKTKPTSRSESRRKKGKGNRMALGAYPRRRESTRRQELVQKATRGAVQGKAWMETHLWHTKRFRMSGKEGKVVGGKRIPTPDRWGYTLAEESSMKSYRSTWRDEKMAATVMDASYDAWIRVTATVRAVEEASQAEEALSKVLQKAGLVDGWQKEWRDGSSCCKTLLTAPVKRHNFISLVDGSSSETSSSTYLRARGPAQVIWVKVQEPESSPSGLRKRQEILLRTHPAAASSLERALHMAKVALSRTLGSQIEIKRLNSLPHPLVSAGSGAAGRRHGKKDQESQSSDKMVDMYLNSMQKKWMRAEGYNVFELSGPTAGTLLAKVLRPINKEDSTKMETIQKGTSVDGTIIPLDVHDPRLSFPPRIPSHRDEEGSTKPSSPSWSSYSRLFTQGYPSPSFRKGEIDRRRSRLATPGSRLLPTSKDDIVPVVVIAHNQTQRNKAFTLLVPRGWGQAFWLSLVHPGSRVIGQLQSHALNFDRGKPSFPFDWAGTLGFEGQEQVSSLIAAEEWHRRPPAKRCNFEKVDVRWPFGGSGLWVEVIRNGWQVCKLEWSDSPDQISPWMFAPSNSLSIDVLKQDLREWSTSSANNDGNLPPTPLMMLIRSALICVKLTACRKGAYAKWDEIHILNADHRSRWKGVLQSLQEDSSRNNSSALQKLESQPFPTSSTHIGSVTTSNFSLSNGKVSAIASISLLAYLSIIMEEDEEAEEVGSEKPITNTAKKQRNPIPLDNLVLVKSVQGGVHRAASLQAVSLI